MSEAPVTHTALPAQQQLADESLTAEQEQQREHRASPSKRHMTHADDSSTAMQAQQQQGQKISPAHWLLTHADDSPTRSSLKLMEQAMDQMVMQPAQSPKPCAAIHPTPCAPEQDFYQDELNAALAAILC